MTHSVHQANHSNSPVTSLITYAQNQRKEEILHNMVPQTLRQYHEECTLHLHALEYYDLTYNCIGVSVQDLVGESSMSFSRMLRSLSREIVELTNMQSGGIGFINFDGDTARYLGTEADGEIYRSIP